MNTINLKSLSKAEMTNNNGGFAIGPFFVRCTSWWYRLRLYLALGRNLSLSKKRL